MDRTTIAAVCADPEQYAGKTVTCCGWVRSVRDMKNFGFVTLHDGSCFQPLQVVCEAGILENYETVARQNVGAALVVHSFGMKKTGRTDGGAPFEKIRRWDEKNPDKAIGKYEDIDAVIAEVQRDRELEAKNKAVQAERKEAAKVSGAKAQADAKALDEIAQARIAQRNAEQAAAAKESADVEGGQE